MSSPPETPPPRPETPPLEVAWSPRRERPDDDAARGSVCGRMSIAADDGRGSVTVREVKRRLAREGVAATGLYPIEARGTALDPLLDDALVGGSGHPRRLLVVYRPCSASPSSVDAPALATTVDAPALASVDVDGYTVISPIVSPDHRLLGARAQV